jgi:eukaryotic-like serine/threonine-protein kinase
MSEETAVRPGDVIGGRFRLVRVLGTGGMGHVLEAEDLELQRRVAVKVMQDRIGNDEGAIARVFREARAAARLQSPHVAKVLDVGRLASGGPYLVMELLEGSDLQAVLATRGPLPVNEAVDYVMQACEALAEAHRAGIVHRDLKPANLFCARDVYGQLTIKLLDFGISKTATAESDPTLTDSRSMMGSPVYMSPEHLRSARHADHRSDIWSLGTVLFELVTARLVWSGASLSEVLVQIASDPAPRLSEVAPAIPAPFAAIVGRCLEKDPARRYQHVADLAAALLPYGGERARATFERVLQIAGDAGLTAETAARGSPARAVLDHVPAATQLDSAFDPRPPRRFGPVRLVLTVAAAALALAAAVFLTRAGPTSDPGSPAAAGADAAARAVQILPVQSAPVTGPDPGAQLEQPASSVGSSSVSSRPKRRPRTERAPVPPPNTAVDPMSVRR